MVGDDDDDGLQLFMMWFCIDGQEEISRLLLTIDELRKRLENIRVPSWACKADFSWDDWAKFQQTSQKIINLSQLQPHLPSTILVI